MLLLWTLLPTHLTRCAWRLPPPSSSWQQRIRWWRQREEFLLQEPLIREFRVTRFRWARSLLVMGARQVVVLQRAIPLGVLRSSRSKTWSFNAFRISFSSTSKWIYCSTVSSSIYPVRWVIDLPPPTPLDASNLSTSKTLQIPSHRLPQLQPSLKTPRRCNRTLYPIRKTPPSPPTPVTSPQPPRHTARDLLRPISRASSRFRRRRKWRWPFQQGRRRGRRDLARCSRRVVLELLVEQLGYRLIRRLVAEIMGFKGVFLRAIRLLGVVRRAQGMFCSSRNNWRHLLTTKNIRMFSMTSTRGSQIVLIPLWRVWLGKQAQGWFTRWVKRGSLEWLGVAPPAVYQAMIKSRCRQTARRSLLVSRSCIITATKTSNRLCSLNSCRTRTRLSESQGNKRMRSSSQFILLRTSSRRCLIPGGITPRAIHVTRGLFILIHRVRCRRSQKNWLARCRWFRIGHQIL